MSLGSWRLACWRAPWPDWLVSFLPQAHADALKQSFRDVNSMLRADSAGPGFCEGSDDVLKVPNRLLLPNTTEEDEDFDADELMSNLSRNSSVRLASLSLSPPPKIMQTIVWDGWGCHCASTFLLVSSALLQRRPAPRIFESPRMAHLEKKECCN